MLQVVIQFISLPKTCLATSELMEFTTSSNLTKHSSGFVGFQNCGHSLKTAQEFKIMATCVLAIFLVFLTFVHFTIKKCATNQNAKSGHKKKSLIQVVSIIELIKTLTRNNFASLPTVGYLLEKHKGAIKFTVGIYKIVLIIKPSIIQKLYLSPNPGHLHKPPEYEKLFSKSLQGNLGTVRASTWKIHRSVLARAFTFSGLREQVKVVEQHSQKLVFELDEAVELQQGSDDSKDLSNLQVHQNVESHIINIILNIATGRNAVENRLENARYCYLIKKFKQLTLYRVERPWLLLDILWSLHPKKWELDRTRTEIEAMFSKSLKTTRKEANVIEDCDESMAGKSLIELMVNAGFTDEEVFKEFLMFVLVNNDAISTNTKLLLFNLALNPDLQEKCRLEIDQMFEKLYSDDRSEMSTELLGELHYLEQCIKETVRMYPTLIFQGRMIESPLVLDEQTTIDPGTRVYISAYHLHRDPKYYPEPEKFDPERFSPENLKKMEKCQYMGFSEGPRNCIGYKSAILEIKVIASYILHNFEVYTNDTREKFEADMGPNRWPVLDPKVELKTRH